MNIQDYRAMRARGLSAQSAFAYARKDVRDTPSLEWTDGVSTQSATWKQDGFDIRVEMTPDEYADLSYLGEFTNQWTEGAIRHERLDSRSLSWFAPMTTEDEHFKSLRAMKFGRTTARERAQSYVQCDYRRLRQCGDAWVPVDIVVTVSRAGIELESAALGPVESDADDSYITEIVLDLTSQAIDEAKEVLGALCAAVQPATAIITHE